MGPKGWPAPYVIHVKMVLILVHIMAPQRCPLLTGPLVADEYAANMDAVKYNPVATVANPRNPEVALNKASPAAMASRSSQRAIVPDKQFYSMQDKMPPRLLASDDPKLPWTFMSGMEPVSLVRTWSSAWTQQVDGVPCRKLLPAASPCSKSNQSPVARFSRSMAVMDTLC